jgi:hypothetical protein
MKEFKRQLRRELLRDLKTICESQGKQFPDINGMMNEEECRSSFASIAAAEVAHQVAGSGWPQGLEITTSGAVGIKEPPRSPLEPDTIDTLAHPTTCNLVVPVEWGYRIKVEKGLVYPNLALLNDISIDSASYVVVKVYMVHENTRNLKLEVPPDDKILPLRDAITRRVQWRRIGIDVDLASTSVSATLSLSQTAPSSILTEPQPELLIPDQPFLFPPRTQSTPYTWSHAAHYCSKKIDEECMYQE